MALFQCVIATFVAAGAAVQPEAPVRRHRDALPQASTGTSRRRTNVPNQLCAQRSGDYPADTRQYSKAACEAFLTPFFQQGGRCAGGKGFYGYNGRNECYCCTDIETVDVNPFTRGGYTTYQIPGFDQQASCKSKSQYSAYSNGDWVNQLNTAVSRDSTTTDGYYAWCNLYGCPQFNSQASAWCEGGGKNACRNQCEALPGGPHPNSGRNGVCTRYGAPTCTPPAAYHSLENSNGQCDKDHESRHIGHIKTIQCDDNGGRTIPQCAEECKNTPTCKGFGYGNAGGEHCSGDKGKCHMFSVKYCDTNPTWKWHALGKASLDFTNHAAVSAAAAANKISILSSSTSDQITCNAGETKFVCGTGNGHSTDGYNYCGDDSACFFWRHAYPNAPGRTGCCYCSACVQEA